MITIPIHADNKMPENTRAEQGEIYVHQIINEFAKEAKAKLGLICIGSGGGMPGGTVDMIEAIFVIYSKGTIDEARRLEVEATEMFLKKINNHKKIRSFLREYPFTANRARVSGPFN